MRLLVFEIWSFKILIIVWKMAIFFIVSEDAQCSETDLELLLKVLRLLVIEIWSILYSKFLVNWGLGRIQKKKNYVKEARPL